MTQARRRERERPQTEEAEEVRSMRETGKKDEDIDSKIDMSPVHRSTL